MAEQPQGEKKIIIDEDWKSQVEREKAELEARQRHAAEASPTPGNAGDADDDAAGQLPPPTFVTLLTSLATQAMLSLGQIPHPATNQPQLDLEQAHYYIELLAMLEVKTNGNRAPEESQLLENIVHELRLAYVTIRDHAAKSAESPKP